MTKMLENAQFPCDCFKGAKKVTKVRIIFQFLGVTLEIFRLGTLALPPILLLPKFTGR